MLAGGYGRNGGRKAKGSGDMRVYLAAPLFSQMERAWNRALARAVENREPRIAFVLPQDFRIGGRFNDPRAYGALFRRCLAAVEEADAVLAVLDGADADSGVAFEVGFAHARGKPVLGLRTDYRPGADHGVNLMCARACRYVIREFPFQEDVEPVAGAVARRLRKLAAIGAGTTRTD